MGMADVIYFSIVKNHDAIMSCQKTAPTWKIVENKVAFSVVELGYLEQRQSYQFLPMHVVHNKQVSQKI